MIGWILMFVGAAWLAFTFAYTRPRRRRQVVEIVQDDPLYVSEEERPETIIVRETPAEHAPQSPVARGPFRRPAVTSRGTSRSNRKSRHGPTVG